MGKSVLIEATPAILKVLLPDDPRAVPKRPIFLEAFTLPLFSVSTKKSSHFRLLLFLYHLSSDSFDTK